MKNYIFGFLGALFFSISHCPAEKIYRNDLKSSDPSCQPPNHSNCFNIQDYYEPINFAHPEFITNQTFVITLGKSGTNLLLSSITKLTNRPVLALFKDLQIVNILNSELTLSKPPIYFGHDYFGKKVLVMEQCKNGGNKLIMTHRNYKENILSYLILSNKIKSIEHEKTKLETTFLDEILNEKIYFELYIERLNLFDNWPKEYRFLVDFKDLVKNPENVFPCLLSFLGEDDCRCEEFIQNYDSFKEKLHEKYSKTSGYTGSQSDLNYFRKHLSREALIRADNYVKKQYPDLWEKYLKDHAEIQ
jgi:hypothetical protein